MINDFKFNMKTLFQVNFKILWLDVFLNMLPSGIIRLGVERVSFESFGNFDTKNFIRLGGVSKECGEEVVNFASSQAMVTSRLQFTDHFEQGGTKDMKVVLLICGKE